ncbi:enoyl-CoA hydratase/isomerase family protein [Wenyingzhuangia sp. chi5]|uniref:Enoyl-CoA hydratase/isomerase family protein n=1 Tax=Wenyingzhuangia gilva TaxID=3057677 RepID=A0ABT8VQC4_9FLAO|nr:enoyl-CoA hydratase/isomerase family protein [Wenyingzhuangia sp. chi5]MDO3694170.1 enoyl-CoA hydratase/isomerase family protein [Wenyingzhuangia sp. chi5]
MEPYVKTTIKDKVAEIEFFSPASNSLASEQLAQLTTAIKGWGENDGISVIHLKSAGTNVFCAGASFDELLAIEDLENGTKFFMGFANVINAIRTCGKIVVTSVQGKTVGGGVGIAAASDYVFATETAAIKLSELSIGIGPFVIEPAVTRKIGLTNMAILSLNATTWKTAKWAQQVGLYHEVDATLSELNYSLDKFLKQLVSYSPQALSAMKKTFWKGTEQWDILLKERAAVSGKLVLSDETNKALTQFKRK